MYTYNNYLIHHGVKGMKWGVRHDPERKAQLIRNKYQTKNKKYDRKIGKIMSKREINRQRLSDKYDKKILKAKNKKQTEIVEAYKSKKTFKLKNFDGGTKMINKGINHYKSVNRTYANMKIKALNDSSIKKTKAYKTAGRNYALQLLSDANYGKAYTTLNYAYSYGRGYKPQKDSIFWKR